MPTLKRVRLSGYEGADPVAFVPPQGVGRRRVLPEDGRVHNAWQRSYLVRMIGLDLAAVTLSSVVAFLLQEPVPGSHDGRAFLAAVVALPLVWVAALTFGRAYEARFLGVGSEE